MKQSDIFSIIIIAMVGTLTAFFVVNNLLGNPDELSTTYKTIQPINANIAKPDPELFNQDAINPTVEVYIGDCEDYDKNGILSHDELVLCGAIEEEENQNNENENEEDGGESGEDDLNPDSGD